MTMFRTPAVAGSFYAQNAEELKASLESLFLGPRGPGRLPTPAPVVTRDIVALVCPHAGYQFSGYAAAHAYLELAEDGIPDSVVIIGPNHRGLGAPVSVAGRGIWTTPLGQVTVDEELADAIISASKYAQLDTDAHRAEHAVEVQIPFLQYISNKTPKIVPIAISALKPDIATRIVYDLGNTIAAALTGKNALIISSTDFTHYESQRSATEKDQMAVRAIEKLDADKLLSTVEQYRITMCGAVPTAVAVIAAKSLGATHSEQLTYYTSGDILGETGQVVGYASLKIVKGES